MKKTSSILLSVVFVLLFILTGCAINDGPVSIESKEADNIVLDNGLEKTPTRFSGRITGCSKYDNEGDYAGYSTYSYSGNLISVVSHYYSDNSLYYSFAYSYSGSPYNLLLYYDITSGGPSGPVYQGRVSYVYDSNMLVTKINSNADYYYKFTRTNSKISQRKKYYKTTNVLIEIVSYAYDSSGNVNTIFRANSSGVIDRAFTYYYDSNKYLQYKVRWDIEDGEWEQGNYTAYDLDSTTLGEADYYYDGGLINRYYYTTSGTSSNYDPFYPLFVYNLAYSLF